MPNVTFQSRLRVRYADTDAMGIVYYAKYFEYFEVARTEFLRACGLPYAKLEELGYFLPVMEASARYFKGAKYDDLLTIEVRMPAEPGVRLAIDYSIVNESQEILVEGQTTLAFVDRNTNKPTRPPTEYREALKRFSELEHNQEAAKA
jgi:acyl-CoA thioester hydrolase